ncbi:MAG: hypothetical protein Hyperionvirus5_49 [Hyperionvirus sp.]|uniref:Uncharacterized protein n=1 Tax=Hyperionvirus sp. TaxID=2487770 RepID=A0A3G5ABJ3_9VIRU|nr:MAG: hypothetical protein Hyperionvirus5_49 [Hyperionvirus sp.]
MTDVTLGGFSCSNRGFFPVYTRPCWSCSEPLKPQENIILMKDLEIINQTPDEIKKLSISDIKKKIPGFPEPNRSKDLYIEAFTPWSCQCEKKDITYEMFAKKNYIQKYNPCCCEKYRWKQIIEKTSWSCPFCLSIVCGRKCFWNHVNKDHWSKIIGLDDFIDLAVEPKILGAEWCPFCHRVSGPRNCDLVGLADDIDAAGLLNELHERYVKGSQVVPEEIAGNVDFTQYCVTNRVCQNCKDWDKKRIHIPKELIEMGGHDSLPFPPIYSHETCVPLYIKPKYIRLEMFLHSFKNLEKNIALCSKFIPDFLRRSYFEEVDFFFTEYPNCNNYVITHYIADLWYAMLYVKPFFSSVRRLRTPEEVRKMKIPTQPLLDAIQADISVINNALVATGLHAVLHPLIYCYLPWQIWNFERIFSKIHSDMIRLGPSAAALLAMAR